MGIRRFDAFELRLQSYSKKKTRKIRRLPDKN